MRIQYCMMFLGIWLCTMQVQAQGGAMLPEVLTLKEAHRIALADSPSLKAAEARLEQAEAVMKQSRSEYLPTLDTTLTANQRRLSDEEIEQGEQTAQTFGVDFEETIETYTGNVSLRYTIFDGFGRKFRNANARLGAERSEESLREAHRLLLNSVSLAYHNVQLARENSTIARADESFNQRQLKEAQLRYKAGRGSLSDTLNFEVRIRSAQSALLQTERSQAVALIVLVKLLGVEHRRVPESMDVDDLMLERMDEMIVPDTQRMVDQALSERPDLSSTRLLLDQTEALVGLGKSNYFPTVSGFLSGDDRRADNSYFGNEGFTSTIGIQLPYTIFSGGRRKAVLNENRAIHREATHILTEQEIQVVAEVQEAAQNLETAQQVLILQRETASLVEQNRDLVEKEYRAGQGSLVRLNQAQRDLTSQQVSLARARVSLRQAWVNLNSATGAILPEAKVNTSDAGH